MPYLIDGGVLYYCVVSSLQQWKKSDLYDVYLHSTS